MSRPADPKPTPPNVRKAPSVRTSAAAPTSPASPATSATSATSAPPTPAGPATQASTLPATFTLDGVAVPFAEGETLIQAATRAGHYVPHLCWHPDFVAQGSCRLCIVKVDGRARAACTTFARAGAVVENRSPELDAHRKTLLQMLFVEGNHFCPSCEVSGRCQLQATAYEMGMAGPHFEEFYPDRPLDASHPDLLLEFNRCILCELCVRASRDVDHKSVFAIGGHGVGTRLLVNSMSGRLADTPMTLDDRAAAVCPVGVILPKRRGFAVPIGERRFDRRPISDLDDEDLP